MAIRERIAAGFLALSAAGLVAIISSEGYTPVAVIPVPGDVPTIGFGTTAGVKPGDTITPPKAVARIAADMESYEGAVKRCVFVPLYQHEYDVFVSFAYNVGGTAFCGSTLVQKLNALDYAAACRELLRWNRVAGRVVPGLTARRERDYRKCIQN